MSEFNAADYGIDWPTTPREIVAEALREFVGDGEGVDGAVFAAFVDEVRAPLVKGLQFILDEEYGECEHFTTDIGSCFKYGRTADAEDGADRACAPCVAHATLNGQPIPTEE